MAHESEIEIKLTVDKFIFRFPRKLRYSAEGLWILQEGGLFRIGMSDFVQQRNGDVAFATLAPTGTELHAGDEIAGIETIKINISLLSPVNGRIVAINALLQDSPELINLEPYGKGWMVLLQPEDADRDVRALMTAEAYSSLAGQQAEAELNS
jgi:glycine cleavage system H protein